MVCIMDQSITYRQTQHNAQIILFLLKTGFTGFKNFLNHLLPMGLKVVP